MPWRRKGQGEKVEFGAGSSEGGVGVRSRGGVMDGMDDMDKMDGMDKAAPPSPEARGRGRSTPSDVFAEAVGATLAVAPTLIASKKTEGGDHPRF